jgi:hypothetical protein
MTLISCDDNEKYLEFSSERFNMALSEPGRRVLICHGRKNSTG